MDPQRLVKHARIDADINSHMDEIRRRQGLVVELRKQRNSLVASCRIPDELLGEIFECVIQRSGRSEESYKWPRPWLLVTHICQHWRRVAIGHRRLWASIKFRGSPNLAEMFAARAGSCPLRVTCIPQSNENTKWSSTIAAFVLAHAHRIRILHGVLLDLKTYGPDSQSGSTQEPHFTLLESLDIEHDGRGMWPFLPHSLPRLKDVSCYGAPGAFLKSLPTFALTNLIVSSLALGDRLDAGSWIAILQGLGTLETIMFCNVFKKHATTLDEHAVVHLPHLKTLTLTETSATLPLLHFFEHCTFPPSATINLNLGYLSNEAFQHDEYFMPSIARVASGSAPSRVPMRPFVSCSIDLIGFELWTADALMADWDPAFSSELSRPGPPPAWKVRFPRMEENVPGFLNAFSFCPLRSLAVELPEVASIDLFLGLGAFPAILELFVNGRDSLEAFIDIHHEMWMTEKTLIPKLERLIIEDVTWMQHNHPMLQREEQSPHLAQQFEGILQSRITHVAPLKYLNFVGSTNLNGWDPLKLSGELVEEIVEESQTRWGYTYVCGCLPCQEFMSATEDEGSANAEGVVE